MWGTLSLRRACRMGPWDQSTSTTCWSCLSLGPLSPLTRRRTTTPSGRDLISMREPGGVTIENVGLVLCKKTRTLSHKPDRAWRPCRCTKYLLSSSKMTGEAIRVWLGHCVDYCELMRLGLSFVHASYRFVEESLGKCRPLPRWSNGASSCLVSEAEWRVAVSRSSN